MTASQSKALVVVGSYNQDFTFQCARLPDQGETVAGQDFRFASGGKGSNQAVAAARLGIGVTLIARVGHDPFGDEALRMLAAEGVDTRYVRRSPDRPTGAAAIVLNTAGDNRIIVVPGANAACTPEMLHEVRQAWSGSRLTLVQLEIPLPAVRAALELGRAHGGLTLLNPAPATALDLELRSGLFPLVDILTPNETEAATLTGMRVETPGDAEAAARALQRLGAAAVVVTLGARGAVLLETSGTVRHIAAPPVKVVDTTGAGDAFNGALAVALVQGNSLEAAVRMAVCAGALSVTRPGAAPAMPTLAELRQRFPEVC
ncbi:MAG: ribokinase [Deltaproteobacteria bacterium]|nr:ribokinase [Deltaproteobacteria bacterium]